MLMYLAKKCLKIRVPAPPTVQHKSRHFKLSPSTIQGQFKVLDPQSIDMVYCAIKLISSST